MTTKINNEIISQFLKDMGISLVSFGDISEVDAESRLNLQYGICIAIALKVFPSSNAVPSYEYYKEYKAVSRQLREISFSLEAKIKQMGYEAYSLSRNHQNDQYITALPFKTLATRSGMGWIGKSGTLITKEYGNAVRLNVVITNMPFEVSEPINVSYCGSCVECVNHCPAGAIIGNNWSLSVERNNLLDPFACKAMVIQRGKAFDVTDGSCGICISVCPWTKRYIAKASHSLLEREVY